MKVIYINCSSGVSGDMVLGALISAGLPVRYVESKLNYLSKFGIKKPFFKVVKTEKKHLPCLSVKITNDFTFNSPDQIERLIKRGKFPDEIKANALRVLDNLRCAESKVHGIAKNKIHFHELNSKDTLIDILGVSIGFDFFGAERIISSPVNIGRINPAAAEIFKKNKVSVYSDNTKYELATPTGAAIISVFTDVFGDMPPITVENFGFGAGTTEIESKDNILRIAVGKTLDVLMDEVFLIETNIDDMNPQIYPDVQRALFSKGALDVWYENIIMKHGRPAVKLAVLCQADDFHEISETIFRETTTAGLRYAKMSRRLLKRKQSSSKKTFFLPDGSKKTKKEYRTAGRKARMSGIPLKNLLI